MHSVHTVSGEASATATWSLRGFGNPQQHNVADSLDLENASALAISSNAL
jgi:hypothetical protein